MIRSRPLHALIAFVFAWALLLAKSIAAEAADAPELYFADRTNPEKHVPVGEAPIEFKAGAQVDLELLLKLPSIDDQRQFVRLVIDDYRYDEPNYFRDKRVPNVVFEVTTVDGKPVACGASSQGSGMEGPVSSVHVRLYPGTDSERIGREQYKLLKDAEAKKGTPEDLDRLENQPARAELIKKFLAFRDEYEVAHAGTYRVRAYYRPKVAGKWIGEVVTKPITIHIAE